MPPVIWSANSSNCEHVLWYVLQPLIAIFFSFGGDFFVTAMFKLCLSVQQTDDSKIKWGITKTFGK